MAKRKLSDLYVRGTELTLDDGNGAVTVWLQKLNPIDHREAIRKADAARAKFITICRDRDSEEYCQILNSVVDQDRELLIGYLVAMERLRLGPMKRSEVAEGAAWKDENYLDGLQDLWAEELAERFAEDPDDAEAKRVHDELERFESEVEKELDSDLTTHREWLDSDTDTALQDKVIAHQVKNVAEAAWVDAYYRWEVFFATREPTDHKKRYFDSFSEVNELDPAVFAEINEAIRQLTVDPSEGKDSAGIPPSSTSSESPEAQDSAQDSGPKAVEA